MGKRLRLSDKEVDIIYQYRADDLENLNHNLTHNSALDNHLIDRGIDKKDVVSVKHWQNMGGELRFSVVTKNALIDEKSVFNNVLKLIGKYANKKETGEDYNIEIAINRVLMGVSGLINKAKGFDVDRVLFCIGNDILHTDNVMSSTSKGTYQDTDGKWWEHYEIALKVYVQCVEMLREIAPVDCVHSMSNQWANTTHRYWYLHHLHHKIKHKWLDAKDYIGVSVEYMRSPSASDSWHSGKGFCGVPKAIEGYLHDKDSGQVARFVHYF